MPQNALPRKSTDAPKDRGICAANKPSYVAAEAPKLTIQAPGARFGRCRQAFFNNHLLHLRRGYSAAPPGHAPDGDQFGSTKWNVREKSPASPVRPIGLQRQPIRRELRLNMDPRGSPACNRPARRPPGRHPARLAPGRSGHSI